MRSSTFDMLKHVYLVIIYIDRTIKYAKLIFYQVASNIWTTETGVKDDLRQHVTISDVSLHKVEPSS